MARGLSESLEEYDDLLSDLKENIRHARTRAMLSVNSEMMRSYRPPPFLR